MSGGRLVVLDRLGRDVKSFPLPQGLATIGSDQGCDICILLPTVSPHHATVVVHAYQTVVNSVTAGETLVNGAGVSVCALRHGDRLTVGGRSLRWEYDDPDRPSALMSLPALPDAVVKRTRSRRKGLMLAPQRASLGASASGKQVAIVQPQRRHTAGELLNESTEQTANTSNRQRGGRHSDHEPAPEDTAQPALQRKSSARSSPKNVNTNDTTKASLWIESRKTPRGLPRALPRGLPRSAGARKSTPLRMAVLRKAQSAHKLRVTKIQAPSKIGEYTKHIAIHEDAPRLAPRRARKSTPLRMAVLRKAQSAHKLRVTKIQAPSKIGEYTKHIAIHEDAPRLAPRRARKSTPLRMAVLRKAQSAHKLRVTKIQAPSKIGEYTKHIAIHEDAPRLAPRRARKSTPLRMAVLRKAQSAHKLRVTKIQAPSKIGEYTKHIAIHEDAPRLAPRRARKSTPLRMAVLRKAQSAHKLRVTKIQAPSKIGEYTKHIAIHEDAPRLAPRRARKSTPLRMAVLRKAQSAHKLRVTKIQAPSKIDHTKQAAIMLMTGHAHKPKQPSPKQRPSFVVKKPSPVRGKVRGSKISGVNPLGVTPKRSSTRVSVKGSEEGGGDASTPTLQSPTLLQPKKSALKSPSKKSTRKTESIKFDLSNLENPDDRPSDVVLLMDESKENQSASDEDISLHYSDTESLDAESPKSPSPRRPIHSRSSRILERSLGETFVHSVTDPSLRKSPRKSELKSPLRKSRGSLIVEKALGHSLDDSQYSQGSTKSSEQSFRTTVASARKTINLSPKARTQMETYSIVDLVSMDSTESASMYGSAASSSVALATPRAGRYTRATNSILSSSTPYVKKKQKSTSPETSIRSKNPSPRVSVISRISTQQESVNASHQVSPRSRESKNYSPQSKNSSRVSVLSRNSSLQEATNVSPQISPRSRASVLSKTASSVTTPENTQARISINSTRVSRASRSRSRINDSDVLLMDDDEESPRSSKRINKSSLASPVPRKTITISDTPEAESNEPGTPENRYSPEEATTPVLSIQNLLDQSLNQSSSSSRRSQRRGANLKRKTIAGDRIQSKKSRSVASARRSLKDQKSALDCRDQSQDLSQDEEEVTTPKTALQPIQEGVKNKHSSAKKPQSKRSLIDNLDESDFVKQLFNSPVKRKLSQSMTEFSRKKLFEDEEDNVRTRPTRNTIAFTGRTPDNSIMDHTEAYTPDVFVSPLNTPESSPNLAGLKRLFKRTPENDLRNVRGVKKLLRSPRLRRSTKNDLTDVAGVKQLFAPSPRNRLSDVRVKELFAPTEKNDLRRVSRVKTLFRSPRVQKSPKNSLQDVRGVKELFKISDTNDLRNVSGVKTVLRVNSPRNRLSDVEGVTELYRVSDDDDSDSLSVVSGAESLHAADLDTTFDMLIGKPRLKAYTKAKSFTKAVKPKRTRKAKSLHDTIGLITEKPEEWLQSELQKRVHKEDKTTRKSNLTRELQKLTTDTVEGSAPVILSRSRNSTMTRSTNADVSRKKSASERYSSHLLPIKKRSLANANRRSNGNAKLPIKKRLLHSTPVKGMTNITMNASELCRVSPIPDVTTVGRTDFTAGLTRELSTRGNKNMNSTSVDQKSEVTTKQVIAKVKQRKPIPKKPSPKKLSPKTPPVKEMRATRATRNKSRMSITITKKKPILSPKPKPVEVKTSNDTNIEVDVKRTRSAKLNQDKLKSPKTTRVMKNAKTQSQHLERVAENIAEENTTRSRRTNKRKSLNKEPPETPRQTRAKVSVKTVVVTKPVTQIKPKTPAKVDEQVTKTVKARRKQTDAETLSEPTEVTQTRRTRNAKNLDIKPITEKSKPKSNSKKEIEGVLNKPEPKQTRRGRNVTSEIEPKPKKGVASKSIETSPSSARNKEKTVETSNESNIPKTRRGQRKAPVTEEITVVVESKTRRGLKSKHVTFNDEMPDKRRKVAQINENNDEVKRGKKSVVETVSGKAEPVRRGRKTVLEVTVEPVGKRGMKAVAEETESETSSTVGRRTRKVQDKSDTIVQIEKKTNTTRNKTSKLQVKAVEQKGKKAVADTENKPTTAGRRGKKDVVETDSEPTTVGRGRRQKDKSNEAKNEIQTKNAKGKKTATPVKEAPNRGGRKKKVESEESTSKEVQSEKKQPATRRKRKVDADATTITEVPAKRQRATRAVAAAAHAEPAESGRGRRR